MEEYDFTLRWPKRLPAWRRGSTPGGGAKGRLSASIGPGACEARREPGGSSMTHCDRCGAGAQYRKGAMGVDGVSIFALMLLGPGGGLAGIGMGMTSCFLLDMAAARTVLNRQATLNLQLGIAVILILIGLMALVGVPPRQHR